MSNRSYASELQTRPEGKTENPGIACSLLCFPSIFYIGHWTFCGSLFAFLSPFLPPFASRLTPQDHFITFTLCHDKRSFTKE